ncbi:hypothetical protein [Planctomyces sp. SH-PL62]|uniref:hypothetical protein n=1 Tax=Planctomyces sp. SH-PL62 TaxID=1636152 RepID=UPI00078E3331|nr:hypothetical protein [Planctomyces sp. SH-PL62]AMV36325.1 hypothetical protein VT85_02710 [Planctomyces sp. SH-PL62]
MMQTLILALTIWTDVAGGASVMPHEAGSAQVGSLKVVVSGPRSRVEGETVRCIGGATMVVRGRIETQTERDLPEKLRAEAALDGKVAAQEIGELKPVEGHPGVFTFIIELKAPQTPGLYEFRIRPEGKSRGGEACKGARKYPGLPVQVVPNK